MALPIHQQGHVEAWQASGLSQVAYCRQLPGSLYLRWPQGHTLELPKDVSPQWLGQLLKCLD